MESSVPDAPVPDQKSQDNTPEKQKNEQKSSLNGHVDDSAPQSASWSESRAVSPRQQATKTEQQADSKSGSTGQSVSEPLLNGDNPGTQDTEPTEPATALELAGEAVPKSDSEPKRSSEAPATLESRKSPVTPSKEPEKAPPASDEKDQKSAQQSDIIVPDRSTVASRAPAGNSDVEPAAEESTNKMELDAAQDTEMTDVPTEKAEEAVGPPSTSGVATISSQDATALLTSEVDVGSNSMSQPAIDTTEKPTSPPEPTGDMPMVDAPGVKVAREREHDASEEPAPKRARTEPAEDETAPAQPTTDVSPDAQAEVVVSGTESAGLTPTALDKLANWLDEETNKREISPFQRREMRKVIGRVKKTKAGGHFRDSVQKLWPALWDSYIAKVDRPMDLAELERGLRDLNGPYNTYGKFRSDLRLIFDNALLFNGPLHDITASAVTAVRAVWEEVLPIPSEEPAKPKSVPKAKPIRESRAVANADAARRQSTGPTASPVAETPANKPPAVATQDQPADRRSSTATEGDRPKRTVRAPKPKDIDYTTKPSRKKLKPELQFAEEVLAEIMSAKNHHVNAWFLDPVDAEGLNIPDYYSVIKKPMDLNKASRMLSGGEISNLKDFDKTVRLIFDNCYKFNGPVEQGNPVSAIAKQLEDLYLAQMKGKDAWLAKYAKANALASASNASDDDRDEEEEDGDDAADAPVDTKAIEELQAKLDEETKKLNSMFLTPNESMIEIQKNIVDMIQKTLIEKAREIQSARTKAKTEKPKKTGKPAKSKTAGPGGRKSTGGVAQSKKAGGSKKAAPKKSLSAADKDQIANAINDLDGPHLDRAIDIIKRDTGQNENNDGELELDIDQLSGDALLKLWELCKKALPNFAKDSAPVTSTEVNRPPAKQAAGSKKAAGGKSKKNKPMNAQEQEERIAKLKELRGLYKDGQEPGEEARMAQVTPGAETSDDSDSEEE
ncbi:transcription regulator BDF1 [Metarhizium album ARSEF 1941]|uniref:Transcription regulator BDF1 n=1 Tax=Metarhizium album (strain ARSEF 1941) TaxID=1081103 RepID=A0A0B2WWC8_METAS|nr:transcription regulator BDF1 [Metarhizium album ARSEF 1941]KHN97727.1 transcription regulator BDF1 [Metarhizium album ARSEF 1941]